MITMFSNNINQLLILLLSLLSLYVIKCSCHYHQLKGKPLDVFYKYEDITKHLSSNELLLLWNDCINKVSSDFRAMTCSNIIREKVIDYSNKYPISLYDNRIRLIDSSYPNKLLPDCQYSISFLDNINPMIQPTDDHMLSFNIIETFCNSNSLFNASSSSSSGGGSTTSSSSSGLPKGGASFEVLAWNDFHQIACDVYDNFNSSYTVICDTSYYKSLYYNISIILDYEHYDAYSDIYGTFTPMNKLLYKGTIKFQDLNNHHHHNQRIHKGNWERIHRRGFPFHDYRWTGLGSTFIPSKSQFQELFGSNAIEESYIVGDSHIRYTWDYYYYLYYGANKLGEMDRKHGYSAHIPGLIHQGIYFATDIGDSLMNQQCPNGNMKKRNYIFHTGPWDLQSAPLRNFIMNGNAFPHLLDGIKVLITKNCSIDSIRLIIVGTMPYPRCTDLNCENSRGYRNNYAINALNEILIGSIQNLSNNLTETYNKFNVFHIDSQRIISPRLGNLERCGNHFLFHPSGSILETTAGGTAVAGEILHLLLELSIHPSAITIRNQKIFLTRGANMSTIVTPLELSPLSTKFHHFRGHIQKDYFEELALIADCQSLTNCTSVYLLDGGIARLIEDVDIFLELYPFLNHFLHTSKIDDIPINNIPIPSRRNSSIYIGENSKEIFNLIINGHIKRFNTKESAIDYLKKNHDDMFSNYIDNVKTVSERDLLDMYIY